MALIHEAEQLIEFLTDDYRAGPLARVAHAYAALGETEWAERAVGAASELTDAHYDAAMRVGSIVEVARVYARLDRMDQAATEVRRAEQLAGTVQQSPWGAHAEAQIVGILAVIGSPRPAERWARSIKIPVERVTGLLLIAEARPQDATRLVDEAERVGRSITAAATTVRALTWVAEAMAKQGRYEDAWRVADETERLAADAEPNRRPGAYAQVAIALARADQAQHAMPLALRAEDLATAVADPATRLGALQQVVEAYARAGDLERAERRALALADRFARAGALSRLAGVLADAGDFDRAAALARTIDRSESLWRLNSLLDVAEAVITVSGTPPPRG
ncbi:hypothetical protein GCM10010109_21180 [Actinoplanes campanulatus]|nr:hypothetical protein GCM10010109_21180 [Actinoplanes campanulatus]GID36634.1 hypothetical protein Aca09nite_31400 [Actinoplanes campanulatus]